LQGKALAGLLPLALAALLIGCGGEDGEEGSAASPGGTPAEDRAAEDKVPPAVAERLQRAKERFEAEKQRKESEQKTSKGRGSPPPPPEVEHEDSGGGAAQFRRKGGDNSIQEFGAEASDPELEQAAQALHAYLDSRAARQWATACSYMSAQLTRSLEQLVAGAGKSSEVSGCAQILAALSKDVPQRALDDAAVADVGSLRADDNRGFILYHGAQRADYAMPMVTEGGAWKVSAMEGSAIL
jgi:hypothetical protein